MKALIIFPEHTYQPRIQAREFVEDSSAIWNACREIVRGGLIEPVYLTECDEDGWQLVAFVNEDGISLKLPLCAIVNRSVHLFGPIVITRQRVDDESECHYKSITADDLRLVADLFLLVAEGPLAHAYELQTIKVQEVSL